MERLKPFLALGLVAFVLVIIILAPEPTGYAVSSSEITIYKSSPPKQFTPSIEIKFAKSYLNVNKITFKGIPGGNLCDAAITLKAYDTYGYQVGQATTARIAAHKPASGTVLIKPVASVYRVVGTPAGDKNWRTSDCGFIDNLEATLYISSDKNAPTAVSAVLKVAKEKISQQASFAAIKTTRYSIQATASDESGIAAINIYLDNALAKSCGSSTTCIYSSSDIPEVSVSKLLKIEAIDDSPSKNKKVYATTFNIGGPIVYCMGGSCPATGESSAKLKLSPLTSSPST